MDFIINKHFVKDTEDYRKAKLFSWNAVIGLTMIVIMNAATANDPIYGKVSMLPLCIPIITSLLIMYFKGWLKLCVDIICISLLLAFVNPILITGGIDSQMMIWLILAPIYALTIGGYKRGIFWTIFTIVLQVSIYFLSLSKTSVYMEVEKFSSLLNQIFYILSILLMMFAYEFIKVKQRKKIEEQVKYLQEQRTNNLNIIKQLKIIEHSLNLSNHELKSFAFAASHDLKEHIQMIGRHVQIIQIHLNNDLDKSTKDNMSSVIVGVKRIEKLLNDLIEYEQIGSSSANKRSLNLSEMVTLIIENFSKKSVGLKVKIELDVLPIVYGSEIDMTLLFTNLIENCFKFRKSNTELRILISFTEKNDKYYFKISDNGIGISESYHKTVFDLFSRLHNRHEYDGSGLGLAACKKIINNLGGDIWIENTEGGGTTITFFVLKENLLKLPIVHSKHELVA